MSIFPLSPTSWPWKFRKEIADKTGATIQDGKGKNGGKAFAIGKGSRAIGGDSGETVEDKK